MSLKNDDILDFLVADLRPVRPMRFREGMSLVAVAAAATIALVAIVLGWRADVLAGHFQPLWLFSNGLFLLLGAASASSAVAMASPQVGQSLNGWKWAGATTALLPLTGVILLISRTVSLPETWISAHDADCLGMGLALGALIFGALTFWLRRGAPTSPKRAGLLVGVASGSVGILAFAFSCPSDGLYHVGIWHSATVLAFAMLGRLCVPHLIRW